MTDGSAVPRGLPAGRVEPLTEQRSHARAGCAGRVSGAAASVTGVVRGAPLTLTFASVLWLLGAFTGSLLRGPTPGLLAAIGVGPGALVRNHWWTAVGSVFWCADLGGYLAATVLLLALVAPAERRLGSGRIALLLIAAQVAGTVIGSALVELGSSAGDGWAVYLAGNLVLGPGAAAVGVAMAFTCRMSALWRRRIRLVLLLSSVLLVGYSGSLSDGYRLVAAVTGLLIGPLLLGRPRRSGPMASTRTERRVLIALTVATLALGPVIAAVSKTPIGPLSVLRYLILIPPPTADTVHQVCANPTTREDCRALRAQLTLSGVGPTIMTMLPVLLLLVTADGLRRGRRAAWWAALLLNLTLTGFAVLLVTELFGGPAEQLTVLGGLGRTQGPLAILLPLTLPLLVAGLLLATRPSFDVRAPEGTYTRLAAVALVSSAVVFSGYLVGAYLLRSDFDRPPTIAGLLLALPSRFVPPGYLTEIDPPFLPTRPAATVLYEWPGVLVLLVLAVGMIFSFRRNQQDSIDGDHARVLALVTTHGGSSFSYLTTWRGNSYWFTDDGRAVIAYRVVGTIAVTTGDPVGASDDQAGAVTGFARFCADRGLTPCLYAVGTLTRDLAERHLQWRSVQVAEETVVNLPGLAFTGKKWQDIRSALNRAARHGITAQWINYRHAPLAVTDQIAAISEEWVADKGLPEMGFTLGGLLELADDHVRCLIAVDDNRTVHAVTSWLPVYRDGKPIAWTLDFMRRRPESMPGIIEFLIATAAHEFQHQGADYLSLSGAPLARINRDDPPEPLQRLLDWLSRTLEPVYGFRSLLDFKAKFQPQYHPRWMAYPDPVALPAIAAAITRCYLPQLTARQIPRLLGKLHHRPTQTNPAHPEAGL